MSSWHHGHKYDEADLEMLGDPRARSVMALLLACWKHDEIARELGATVQEVRSLEVRARRVIREAKAGRSAA
jgi:DNA-directed RNA polymerase specialized sigma24 family protein